MRTFTRLYPVTASASDLTSLCPSGWGGKPKLSTSYTGQYLVKSDVQKTTTHSINEMTAYEASGSRPGIQGISYDFDFTSRNAVLCSGKVGTRTIYKYIGSGAMAAGVVRFRPELKINGNVIIDAMLKSKTQLNAPMTAAGLRSTAKTVLGHANIVARILTALVAASNAGTYPRGTFKRNQPKDSNTLSDLWLKSQFVYGQAISDLKNSMASLSLGLQHHLAGTRRSNLIRFTAKRSTTYHEGVPYMQTPWNLNTSQGTTPRWTKSTAGSQTATYEDRCVLYYRMKNAVAFNATAYGLTNPAFLAWDAIPLSFVVDWFLNIGPLLNALDASNGLSFVGGTVSVKETVEASGFQRLQRVKNGQYDISYGKVENFYSSSSEFRYKRWTIQDPLGLAYANFSLLRDSHLDLWRLTTSTALLLNMTRRRR